MDVYVSGPLRGRPIRGGALARTFVSPPIEDRMKATSEYAPLIDWTYSGDTALNDQLDIPGIPADAVPPPLQVAQARPFRSGSAFVVVLIACTLLYFAVHILVPGAE